MMGLDSGFCGSYQPSDVSFLLKPVRMPFMGVEEKELEIQSGRRHYSEMLSPEQAPTPEYVDAFGAVFSRNRGRVGRDIARLAKALAERSSGEIVLVSLARAGTPIGVLLRRTLAVLGREAIHYSISIIRDRGIDVVAMKAILSAHSAKDVVFVDGWTGKGAIATELAKAKSRDFPELDEAPFCVLSDLAGVADLAPSDEDYVIPSAILNGVISGLISRTILNDDLIGPGEFHGCVFLNHLTEMDLSQRYVQWQMEDVLYHLAAVEPASRESSVRLRSAEISASFVESMLARTGVKDRNRIKPGIGEATRALLRRVPERLFIRGEEDPNVSHLVSLAAERNVNVEVDADLPYGACAVIKMLGDS